MSANNRLVLKQYQHKWVIYDEDVESEKRMKIDERMRLESAIKIAQAYMLDNNVEYGLYFEFR